MSWNPWAGIVPIPRSPIFGKFKHTLRKIKKYLGKNTIILRVCLNIWKNGLPGLGTMPAPGFQLTRTYSYGKWSKSWKILRGKRVRGAQKFPVFDFKDLLSGLWEVVWPDMAMVAYFHINWPNFSYNIRKASNQWPGFVDSYSHNVLRVPESAN